MDRDRDLLRLASVLHYVLAAFKAFSACVFLLTFGGLGTAFLTLFKDVSGNAPPPPPAIGWLFVCIGAFVFLYEAALAVALIVAGRSLARGTRYTFCFVVAALACLSLPLGTALGVFTIILLLRPTVRTVFGRPP
jgi:hypothetical protein